MAQGRLHRFQIASEINLFPPASVFDKGKIEVARIVIYRAAAGDAPHHGQIFAPHKFGVDFFCGALMAAHDDGRAVLPEQKISGMLRRQGKKKLLLKGQIQGGIK